MKRELGESPKRTGHCNQGVGPTYHCTTQECEKVEPYDDL